ncbi:putative Major facilitator superfamily (MFS) profile domain-containing protein [Seiridium cardinale]|uniref:Major facilitator superfamily (MFS) profile domain-containing protein n=1 Tax=Seiridium cardinale TaxID=138064 RepID=A0ABR2XNW5_9PEZI
MALVTNLAARSTLRIATCLLVVVIFLYLLRPWEFSLVKVLGDSQGTYRVSPLGHLGGESEQRPQLSEVEDDVATSALTHEPGPEDVAVSKPELGYEDLARLSVEEFEANLATDQKWRPSFPALPGFFDGIRSLISFSEWKPQQEQPIGDWGIASPFEKESEMALIRVNISLTSDLNTVASCYLDEQETIASPDVFAYPGVPANMPAPYFGDYKELGLTSGSCYDRYGRFGPYGYSYSPEQGGLGLSNATQNTGTEAFGKLFEPIDYRQVNWGRAQKRCYEKNAQRFRRPNETQNAVAPNHIRRHAFVLRAWENYNYTDAQLLSIRAMVNELSLKSGAEYDVHILVEIKDLSQPIWGSPKAYREVLERNTPREFWGITTLWSEDLLRTYYSTNAFEEAPTFQENKQNSVTGVFRSGHWPTQWFSQQHPEYEFFWNWEMDVRYTGHYYEFTNAISQWSDNQPRKGLWERNAKFWIPSEHGSWSEFVDMVENTTARGSEPPIWGPAQFEDAQGLLDYPGDVIPPTAYGKDNYEWGVGEAADLVTFNPIFDVEKSTWLHGTDVTGYNTTLGLPPRRCSVVAVTRMSKRLLNLMHEETWKNRHSMFPEVFPASISLHYGLKAVYTPIPVYLDSMWNLKWLDRVFNWPKGKTESVFSFFDNAEPGFGEFNHLGSTFYFLNQFGGSLWRRWMGAAENDIGGVEWEEEHSGRMCLRPILIHPVKSDGI